MSAIESIKFKCDHCGFECISDEGDGDDNWLHAENIPYGLNVVAFDLCPNCVSELKIWLRAGPQHEAYREAMKAQESVMSGRRAERMALSRHPAGNARVIVDRDEGITFVPETDRPHAF